MTLSHTVTAITAVTAISTVIHEDTMYTIIKKYDDVYEESSTHGGDSAW